MKHLTLFLLTLLLGSPAMASLSEQQLAKAVARPPAGAMLPATLGFTDLSGRRVVLGQIAAGKPAVLLFADYSCKHICGPGLAITARALGDSGLTIGRDYVFVIIGMDPRDGLNQARMMRHMRLSAFPVMERNARFLVGSAASVQAATAALGYGYVYDPATDQFAHDASLYVFAADGHLARLLPELALSPALIRAAITHSGTARAQPNVLVQAARLCYGFAAAHGVYGKPVLLALRAMGVLLLVSFGLAFGLLRRRRKKGPLMLPQASTYAPRIDALFWLLMAISGVIMLLVATLLLWFSIKYRRGSKARRGALPTRFTREVEIGWTAATLFSFIFILWWGTTVYVTDVVIPKNAMEIHVVAKQWMWKAEHPDGQREIDGLHLPLGAPVKLVMTSQDVIHSFFVPAFRVKEDVLPGRYTELNFTPSKIGTFHLFCAEYCGTDHSRMIGSIVVMPAGDFARWSMGQPQGDNLAQQGKAAFERLGCTGCHGGSAVVRAPSLAGIYGRPQPMQGGGFKTADEGYLRDSILLPQKDVVAGYAPVMPSYQGVASEEDVIALVAYLKQSGTGASR